MGKLSLEKIKFLEEYYNCKCIIINNNLSFEENYKKLITEIEQPSKFNLEWKCLNCDEKYIFTASYTNFHGGIAAGCLKCKNTEFYKNLKNARQTRKKEERNKHTLEELNELALKKGGKFLNIRIDEVIDINIDNITKFNLNINEFNNIKNIYENYILEYPNTILQQKKNYSIHNVYFWKCKCENIWCCNLNNIVRTNNPSWCNACINNKAEYLTKCIIEYIFQKKFNKIRINNREIDICNKELALGIEYEGRQHYQYEPFLHQYDINNLYKQQERDKEKIDICKNNNIDLVLFYEYEKKNKIDEEYILFVYNKFKSMDKYNDKIIKKLDKNDIENILNNFHNNKNSSYDNLDEYKIIVMDRIKELNYQITEEELNKCKLKTSTIKIKCDKEHEFNITIFDLCYRIPTKRKCNYCFGTLKKSNIERYKEELINYNLNLIKLKDEHLLNVDTKCLEIECIKCKKIIDKSITAIRAKTKKNNLYCC